MTTLKICTLGKTPVTQAQRGEVSHRQRGIVGGVGGPAFILQLLHHLQHEQPECGVLYVCAKELQRAHTHAIPEISHLSSSNKPDRRKHTHIPNIQHKPGSWHFSARCPQPRPLVGGGPNEPQLSTLLSSKRKQVGNITTQTCKTSL